MGSYSFTMAILTLVALIGCGQSPSQQAMHTNAAPTLAGSGPSPPRTATPENAAPATRAATPDPAKCVNGLGDATWPRINVWHDDGNPVPLPMPALGKIPSTLVDDVKRCRAATSVDSCLRLADHMRRVVPPSPAMDLYRRASELDYAKLLKPASKAGGAPIADAAGALAAFQRQWFAEVVPALPETAHRELITELGPCMAGKLHYLVTLLPRREVYRRLHYEHKELGGRRHAPLLRGRLQDAGGPGQLWHVYYGGSLPGRPIFGGYAGYLDPDTGHLVIAVTVKEG